MAADGGRTCHQHGPQTDQSGLTDRLQLAQSMTLLLVGKFHNQNSVFRNQSHKSHQTHL